MAFRRLHQAFKHLRISAGDNVVATDTAPRVSRSRHAARRPDGRAADCSSTYGVEHLEDRCLLTTVHGGDTFEYRQTIGGTESRIRVILRGNITAELIGSQIDRLSNTAHLVNLPGELNG